ncbi:MAG: hypothetical protein ACRC7N_05935 [Clostridium sp.]
MNTLPMPIITSIISAISIVVGSLVGAFFSWLINKKMHTESYKEKINIRKEDRELDEMKSRKEKSLNGNLIRLDISTAIFQSIRGINNNEIDKIYFYILPLNKHYANALSSLSDEYSLKELSHLYQLYGIIEKVNRDIIKFNNDSEVDYELIKRGFSTILYKIYGDGMKEILKEEINDISYEELINSAYINEEYGIILKKLNSICNTNY